MREANAAALRFSLSHSSAAVCAQVFDSKVQKHGRPVALGEFSLPLATLLLQPQMLFANPLPLTNKFGYDSYIYLAIALRVLRSVAPYSYLLVHICTPLYTLRGTLICSIYC